jgi:predicted  nucleic acid-binding Zn-ribbon protein
MNLWSSEQLLVTVSGPEGRREFVVPRPFARIGSHPDSEVVLTGIAKRALYVHASRDGLFCLDLDVEDAVLEKRGRWLERHDTVHVGPYLLSVRLVSGVPPAVPPPPSPVAWGSAGVPLPVMNVHCQRLLKDKRRFRARLNLVGRRPQCALQLRSSQVSSFHCALFWDQRRLWCVDLLSSNGTQLNGAKIDFCEVRLSDRIDVGEFTLVYYRWSPRRSMQPGWQPATDVQDHDQESSEIDGSSPVLDAASPPSAAAADLALFTELADSEGSDVALDAEERAATEMLPPVKRPPVAAPPPPRDLQAERRQEEQRQELLQELAQLKQERQQLQAQQTELQRRLADQAQEFEAQTARHAGELNERSQQLANLQTELSTAAASAAQWQTKIKTLTDEKAAAEQSLAQREAEVVQLAAAKAAAEALAAEPRAPAVSPEDVQVRELLAAEVGQLTQERDDLQRQWSESSQRFAAQIAQLNAETDRLAQEQAAAQTAQDQWQTERGQLESQLGDKSRQLADLQTQLAAATAALALRQTELQSLAQQKESHARQAEAQLARLGLERQDLQTQWTAASQQLATQTERTREQAARLAEVRGSFDAARQEWQAERQSLTAQLAQRGQQLAQLQAELATAQALIAQQQCDIESLVNAPAPASSPPRAIAANVSEPLAMIESAVPETAGDDEWPAEELNFDEAIPEPVVAAAPPTETNAAADTATEPDALPVFTRSEPPAGRRNKAQRHEITTFVGDRLIEMDTSQRRKSLVLWASVAAGALALSVLILGVWYFIR